jgi:AraC family transcriptional regulator of adaptative response / DNA-3-methyladenine glycosylase II
VADWRLLILLTFSSVAGGGLSLHLPFVAPLDWDAMLAYFARRAIAGVEHVSAGTYRRTILIEGDPGALELSLGSAEHLVLRAYLPGRKGLNNVEQRARRIFNLDADVEGATEHLRGDPVVGPLIRARPGIRPPGTWDPFEIGVRAIIGQQVSVAGAGTIAARVVRRHGTPLPGLEAIGLSHLFPSPSALAVAVLGGVGLTLARAATVKAFARAVADHALALDRGTTLDQLVESITAIAGLGPWTAHYLALRVGERDAFPAADLGIRRALGGPMDGPVTPRDAEEMAGRWRPWRAQAAISLWLGTGPGSNSKGGLPAR